MPTVALDLGRVDANVERFHRATAAAGARVRAHLKAHRTLELARRQVDAGATGVAVHTAHAARRLAAIGVSDVVVAWPWPDPWRFPLYAEAAAAVPRLAVHVDRPESVTGIGRAASAHGTEVGVRIDLRHTPAPAVPELARLAAGTAGVRFEGVSSYRAPTTTADIRDRYEFGRRHAQEVVAAAETIRSGGIDVSVVCVGGTPTAAGAASVAGVTEICAGAYATLDGGLAAAGIGTAEQVAVSVAADAAGLLADCTQPWAPDTAWYPAAPPDPERVVPAHICPFTMTMLQRGLEMAVFAGGRRVETWTPFAAPDRE